MFWVCFAASGTENGESVQSTMKSQDEELQSETYRPVSGSSDSVTAHGSPNRIMTQNKDKSTTNG